MASNSGLNVGFNDADEPEMDESEVNAWMDSIIVDPEGIVGDEEEEEEGVRAASADLAPAVEEQLSSIAIVIDGDSMEKDDSLLRDIDEVSGLKYHEVQAVLEKTISMDGVKRQSSRKSKSSRVDASLQEFMQVEDPEGIVGDQKEGAENDMTLQEFMQVEEEEQEYLQGANEKANLASTAEDPKELEKSERITIADYTGEKEAESMIVVGERAESDGIGESLHSAVCSEVEDSGEGENKQEVTINGNSLEKEDSVVMENDEDSGLNAHEQQPVQAASEKTMSMDGVKRQSSLIIRKGLMASNDNDYDGSSQGYSVDVGFNDADEPEMDETKPEALIGSIVLDPEGIVGEEEEEAVENDMKLQGFVQVKEKNQEDLQSASAKANLASTAEQPEVLENSEPITIADVAEEKEAKSATDNVVGERPESDGTREALHSAVCSEVEDSDVVENKEEVTINGNSQEGDSIVKEIDEDSGLNVHEQQPLQAEVQAASEKTMSMDSVKRQRGRPPKRRISEDGNEKQPVLEKTMGMDGVMRQRGRPPKRCISEDSSEKKSKSKPKKQDHRLESSTPVSSSIKANKKQGRPPKNHAAGFPSPGDIYSQLCSVAIDPSINDDFVPGLEEFFNVFSEFRSKNTGRSLPHIDDVRSPEIEPAARGQKRQGILKKKKQDKKVKRTG